MKVSLRTDNFAEARQLWVKEQEGFNCRKAQALESLEGTTTAMIPTRSKAHSLVREWHRAQLEKALRKLQSVPNHKYEELHRSYREDLAFWSRSGVNRRLDAMSAPIIEVLCERAGFSTPDENSDVYSGMALAIHRSRADVCKRLIARLTGDNNDHPEGSDRFFMDELTPGNDAARAEIVNPGSTNDERTFILAEVIDLFVGDPTFSRTSKTRKSYRQDLSHLEEYFGSERNLRTISHLEMDAFVRNLLEAPSLQNADNGATTDQSLSVGSNVALTKRMSRSTAKKVVGRVKGLFAYCLNRQLIENDVSTALRVTLPSISNHEKRRSFTPCELQKIFSSRPLYGDGEINGLDNRKIELKGSRFWLPLVGLYTGMRLNEICQLWSDDICFDEGVTYIRIVSNPARNQRLKTAVSERLIPVHSELLKLGFAEWMRSQIGDPPKHIFEDLPYSETRSNYSDTASKRFANLLRSLNLSGSGRCFHSFRHTFRDALREADVDTAIVNQIGGWKTPGTSHHYGSGYSLKRLSDAVERVRFTNEDGDPLVRSLCIYEQ